MAKIPSVSQTSVRLRGKTIPGAEDRQKRIAGFEQEVFSRSKIVCIGAGGLIGHIAPTLARKGVGAITILDNDEVEISNLNRQRFYESDLGRNKAIALAQNLQRECIHQTQITGYALHLEAAIATNVDLLCNVAICGVDNHPARLAACRFFLERHIPVIFTAVSADADHGYVFVQEKEGPCFGCVFPDAIGNETYPCPGTPAISEILQIVGGIAVYAVDTCLMSRRRAWNYREIYLSSKEWDSGKKLASREDCSLCVAAPVY